MAQEEMQAALQRLSGTKLDAAGAANVWTGILTAQRQMDLVGALNYRAGTTGLGLCAVWNRLAGTTGMDATGAAAALVGYGLKLPGTAGNYASSPDSVLNSVTGDLDIRVLVKIDTWTTGGALVSKWITPNRSYTFIQSGVVGKPQFATSMDGTSLSINFTATNAAPWVAGTPIWFRATVDVDNGSGQSVTTLYYSLDGMTWTSLGSSTIAGVVSIFDGTAPLQIGSESSGAGSALSPLTVYYAEIRNGIDGEVVSRFDASKVQSSGAMVPATIDGWTANGSALYRRDDYIRLPGTAGNYLSYPDTVANSVTGDIDIRCKVAANDWTPAASQAFIAKYVGGQASFIFELSGSGLLVLYLSTDGTALVSTGSSVAVGLTDGAIKWVRVTWRQSDGRVQFFMSDDGVAWAQLGTDKTIALASIFDSTTQFALGTYSTGGGSMLQGNVYAAEVRNGIDGPVVTSFDARDIATPWALNGTGWSWEGASFAGKPNVALSLSGGSSDWVTAPDIASFPTGDIDLRVKASIDVAPGSYALIGKWGTASSRSAYMRIVPGPKLAIIWTPDGTFASGIERQSSNFVLPLGTPLWFRTTLDVDNGAAGHDTKFYTSTDGIAWTLISASTGGGVTSIFDGTDSLAVGQASNALQWLGKVHYAEVRNGIDGPIVARFDPTAIARTGVRTPTTTVQPGGTPNLLTPNQASFETDTTGWTALTNCSIARSTVQFLDGAASLAITASGIGISEAYTTSNITPVVPGKQYTARASFRASTADRPVRVQIHWYTAANAFISQALGSATDVTTGWTEATVTAVAPATAAFGAIVVRINDATQLAAEVHYVDRVSLVESAATWTMNGTAWDLVQV